MTKINQKLNKKIQTVKNQNKALFKLFIAKSRPVWYQFKNHLEIQFLNRNQVTNLGLVCLIVLFGYIVIFQQHCDRLFAVPEPSYRTKSAQEIRSEKLAQDLKAVVGDHPIAKMVPYIAKQDRTVAAYLIGIAKKESNWGKHHPVLAGEDCYNYWGFRAVSDRMGSGGHTCFDSPREAVDAVAKRVAEIIQEDDVHSAKDMLVWKCGSSCAATGGQAAANKWARDVDMYAQKILN